MKRNASDAEIVEIESRKRDATFRVRKHFDRVYSYVRSCGVCASFLPPIDLLCERCWTDFGRIANRGEKLKQPDYPFPVYSLLTWTPATEVFVKPFVYAFKGGRHIRAAEKLATFFLSERLAMKSQSVLVSAPGASYDHSTLLAHVLARQANVDLSSCLRDISPRKTSQKRLSQAERAERRFEIREVFAGRNHQGDQPFLESVSSKRILFADDVITSGATAMAAYMALGDPAEFEVWTLAARPRLAGKTSVCYSPATP